jgi:hypothetical protein
MLLHTTNDDQLIFPLPMFPNDFQWFIIIYVNLKIVLIWITINIMNMEKHINLPFHIHYFG